MTTETTVGQLTMVGPASELLIAKCTCGNPVLVAKEDWGQVLGCPVCHPAEAQRLEAVAEAEAKAQAAQKRAEAEQAKNLELYVHPHFEDLGKQSRRLFKLLSTLPTFTVTSVANALKCDLEQAWEEILKLLEANCIIERVGIYGEVRPYSESGPYAAQAQSSSTYSCRGVARRQMKDLEAQEEATKAAEVEPAGEPQPPKPIVEDPFLDAVKVFIAERCVVEPRASEPEVLLRSRNVVWSEENKKGSVTFDQFSDALTKLGYPLTKANKRQGLRLKKRGELVASAAVA